MMVMTSARIRGLTPVGAPRTMTSFNQIRADRNVWVKEGSVKMFADSENMHQVDIFITVSLPS